MFNVFRQIMNCPSLEIYLPTQNKVEPRISISLNLIFVPNLLKQPCQFLLLLPLVAHVHDLSYDFVSLQHNHS